MIKIGIDLSLNSCGIVAIDENNKIVDNRIYSFVHRKMDIRTYIEVKKVLDDLFENIIKKGWSQLVSCYIELGNYGNAAMTQKFACVASMFVAALTERSNVKNKTFSIEEVKFITPNEWFIKLLKYYGENSNIANWTRPKKKEFSKQKSKIWQDDLADAYWIAYFGKDCKDFF